MQTRSQTRKLAAEATKVNDTIQTRNALSKQNNDSQELKVNDSSDQPQELKLNDSPEQTQELEPNDSPEQPQELELNDSPEQIQKLELNPSAEQPQELELNPPEKPQELDLNHSSDQPQTEQHQEFGPKVAEVQEQIQEKLDEYNDDSVKDVEQQEYQKSINVGCENEDSSENEEDLVSLLKKAEESLRTSQSNQSTKTDNKKMQKELNFPSLNIGISIDEQLYIKKHPGGIATLRQDEIILQDNSSQKHEISNKAVLSSSSSKTDDDDQSSYVKLSKKEKKKLRESTTGPGWFDMKKPEITPEIKRDLQIIKLRNVLDPKRFYKKDDSKELPKYFEIGTIKEGPTEFYSSRIPRKERKQTIADELLADEQSRNYFKRKFAEIQEVKQSGGKRYYNQLREKRKKKT